MKNLILVALASLSMFSTANAATLAAELKSVDMDIKSVQLNDDGQLLVVKADDTSKSLQLSKSNMQSLLYTAQELASADLTVDHSFVICMMMLPQYEIQDLYVADTSGALKMILSMRSCALADYTHPKDVNQLQMAESLKAQLIVLAHQLVKN